MRLICTIQQRKGRRRERARQKDDSGEYCQRAFGRFADNFREADWRVVDRPETGKRIPDGTRTRAV